MNLPERIASPGSNWWGRVPDMATWGNHGRPHPPLSALGYEIAVKCRACGGWFLDIYRGENSVASYRCLLCGTLDADMGAQVVMRGNRVLITKPFFDSLFGRERCHKRYLWPHADGEGCIAMTRDRFIRLLEHATRRAKRRRVAA